MSREALNEISTYQRLLPINKHDLDRELEVQAEMMYHISEAKVRAASEMHQAKDHLDTVEAKVYLKIRDTFSKPVVKEIDSLIQRDPERQQAWREYQAAREQLERWEGMLESWKARGFAISKAADLFLGNYFVIGSAGNSRRDEYEESRRAVADARRSQREAKPNSGSRRVTLNRS